MARYTFYRCRSDGGSYRTESDDLPGDVEALARGARLFARDSRCAYLAIYEGERLLAPEGVQAVRPAKSQPRRREGALRRRLRSLQRGLVHSARSVPLAM